MASGTLASLFIKLGIDASGIKSGLAGVSKDLGGLQRMGTVASGIAGGLVGDAAMVGVQSFVQFDDQMREVFSILPGISADAMNEMKDQVRGLAKEYGTTTEDISAGLYDALSSGVSQENAFAFMEIATKTAKAGVADTASTVKALAAVSNAYSMSAEETKVASDQMFKAVEKGVTTIPELSASLAQVTPIASAMGVGFDEVLGSITAMTLQGTGTSEAITQIRSAMIGIQKGTPSLNKVIGQYGYETSQAAFDTLGFQGTLELLRKISDETGIPLIKLTGRIEGAAAVTQLTGEKMEAAKDSLEAVRDSTGSVDRAFEIMEGGIGGTVRRMQAQLRDWALSAGEFLAPVAPLMMAFGPQMGRWIGRGVGAAIGIGIKLGMPVLKAVLGPLAEGAAGVFSKVFGSVLGGASGLFSKIGGGMADKWGSAMGGKFGMAFKGAAVLGLVGIGIALVDQFNQFQETVKNSQKDLADKAAAERDKTGAEAIADMAGFAKKLNEIQGWERVVADTAGGGQMMEAFRGQLHAILKDTTLTTEQISSAIDAMNAAIVEASARGNTDVVNELTAGIAQLTALKPKATAAGVPVGAALGEGIVQGAQGPLETLPSEIPATTARMAGYTVGARWANGVSDGILGTLNRVSEASSAIGDAMAEGPKIVPFKKRMQQFHKATVHVLKMMHRAVEKNDPAAAAYYAKQYANIRAAQSDFAGSTETVWADVATVIDDAATGAGGKIGQMSRTITNKALRAQLAVQRSAKRAGEAWPTELAISAGATKTAGGAIVTAVTSTVGTLPAKADAWGDHAGDNFNSQLLGSVPQTENAARSIANAVSRFIAFSSPPREGPLHDIRSWGPHMVMQWAKGAERGLPTAEKMGLRLAGAMSFGGPRMAGAGVGWQSVSSRGAGDDLGRSRGARGDRVHIHVGTLIANDQGIDELERRMAKRMRLRGRAGNRYNDPS